MALREKGGWLSNSLSVCESLYCYQYFIFFLLKRLQILEKPVLDPTPNKFWSGSLKQVSGQRGKKVNFASTVGSQVSATSGTSRRPLVSSRRVLGGWRLSQMSPRTESDPLLQVTSPGKFSFHHWLGWSKGRLGYCYPLWVSMIASGQLRFLSTKDKFWSGTAVPLGYDFNYQEPHLLKN